MTSEPAARPRVSPFIPLRHPVFRGIWLGALVSQIGSFMTDVGQGWLMTTLGASPFAVALLTTAESLPIFLLSLPAGAMADIVDRRRLLITAQLTMALIAATLVAVTALGVVTPEILIGLAAAMGIAAAANSPAWLTIPSDVLPKEDLVAGVTLNSVGFNVARVLGPALGGLIVATAGPAVVFAIDATSFVIVALVLFGWHRQSPVTVLPAERLVGAMKAGFRFARHSPSLRRVLVHAFGFISCACISLALLPVLAKETRGGPLAYGALLGSLGLGAVIGTLLLPRIRAKFSSDAIILAAGLAFAAACTGMGFLRNLALLSPIFVAGGFAWMSMFSTLNVAAQRVSPGWVRARALAVYVIVFQAGLASGSALWGFIATHYGLSVAYFAAGAALASATLVLARVHIAADEALDLTPTRHWPAPEVVGNPDPESGPVVVQIEYRIDPRRAPEFVEAARDLERIRRRDGAVEWWLLRDANDPALYVEIFALETWAEHLRQHERVSAADLAIEERVQAFHTGGDRPKGRHLLAADATARLQEVDASGGTITGSLTLP